MGTRNDVAIKRNSIWEMGFVLASLVGLAITKPQREVRFGFGLHLLKYTVIARSCATKQSHSIIYRVKYISSKSKQPCQ